jgi:ADP-ribosylglycohydrolase
MLLKLAGLRIRSKTRGVFLGGLIGDAVGAPLNHRHYSISDADIVAAFYLPGGGMLDLKPAQITDEGELMLVLAHTLSSMEDRTVFPLDDVARAYSAWYRTKPPDIMRHCEAAFRGRSDGEAAFRGRSDGEAAFRGRSDGEAAFRGRSDGEAAFRGQSDGEAAAQMRRSVARLYAESTANSLLTRAAVIAIWSPLESVTLNIRKDASLTHPNRVAQDVAAIYGVAITLLIRGYAPASVLSAIDEYLSFSDIVPQVRIWYRENSRVWPEDCREDRNSIMHGFVLSFYSLRRIAEPVAEEDGFDSYESIIKKVLKCGGNTDSNAATVGAMIGAIYEPSPELVEKVEGAKTGRPSFCRSSSAREVADILSVGY